MDAFVSLYYNNTTVENLCKLLANESNAKLVIVSWMIEKNYWFIAGIFDISLSEQYTVGRWFINELPDLNNVPIVHSKVLYSDVIESDYYRIIIGSDKVISKKTDKIFRVLITAIVDKLIIIDEKVRYRQKQELLLNFIGKILRQPLNKMTTSVNLISESKSISDKLKIVDLQLPILYTSCVKLATNISDVIDLTKLELGKLVLDCTIFDIRDMIHSIQKIATSILKDKKLNLYFHVEDSVPTYIYSDRQRFKQIIVSILDNSIQYTSTGDICVLVRSVFINTSEESVERDSVIEIQQPQHNITFTITDTGCGIDQKIKHHLFKPGGTINAESRGISLRLSHLLARELGGNLSLLKSDAFGTTIQFSIDVFEEEPPKPASSTKKTLGGKNILVIDPERKLTSLVNKLDKYNIRFKIVSTYEEIFTLYYDFRFDLIIFAEKNELLSKSVKMQFSGVKTLSVGFEDDSDYSIMEFSYSTFRAELINIFT